MKHNEPLAASFYPCRSCSNMAGSILPLDCPVLNGLVSNNGGILVKFDYLKLVERIVLQGQVRNQLQRFRFVKNADIGDIKVVISQGRAQNVDLLFCYRL